VDEQLPEVFESLPVVDTKVRVAPACAETLKATAIAKAGMVRSCREVM
jgi:hypothetical protein